MHTQRGAHSKASGAMAGAAVRAFPSIIGLCRCATSAPNTLGPQSARDHTVAKEEPNQCEISKDGDLPGKKARECTHAGGRRSRRRGGATSSQHKIKISRLNRECIVVRHLGSMRKFKKGQLYFSTRLNFVCGYTNKIIYFVKLQINYRRQRIYV